MIAYHELIVIWGNDAIPTLPFPKLLKKFENSRVSTTFVTEDDLTNEETLLRKVRLFIEEYGMNPEKIQVIVAIAVNPTSKWGQGFPYQIRISVFPQCEETRKIRFGNFISQLLNL